MTYASFFQEAQSSLHAAQSFVLCVCACMRVLARAQSLRIPRSSCFLSRRLPLSLELVPKTASVPYTSAAPELQLAVLVHSA